MLKLLFVWFDSHPQSYWAIAAGPTTLLLGWAGRSIWLGLRTTDSKRNEILFALLLFAVLLAWRWPFLLSADEYNPDESQLIAGALTVQVDPVPWRGVDGFTSGPLNFYPLLLPRIFGLPLDYFTARFVGLLLIWGALVSCWRLFQSWIGNPFGALLVFPALAFFCTVTDWDFIHYSSEHLSLFLLAVSAWCILRRNVMEATSHRWRLTGCFVAGLLSWAKLQSAPLAATLVIAAAILATRANSSPRPRLLALFPPLALAAAPTAGVLLLIIATGQFEHFFHSYLLQNFTYVNDGASVAGTVRDLWRTSRMTNHFPLFLTLSLLGSLLALLVTRHAAATEPRRPSLGVSIALFAASLCCIVTPRRALLHYVLFSIVPLSLLFGITMIRWVSSASGRTRLWVGEALLVLGFLLPLGLRGIQPVPAMYGNFAAHWREPRTILANIIRSNVRSSNSRLAIWGWLPSLYVETGLPQGTRDGNTSWAMMPSPHRQYYVQRFLADVERNQPDFFVDAVGFGSRFFPDRASTGHESAPPLASYVAQHYKLIVDEGYARLYFKNELNVSPPPHGSTDLLSIGGHEETSLALLPESISPPDLPRRKTRTGYAQMMNPPAEIVWALDERTREVTFEYGFAPEAYRNANRSDGVELIFELRSKDAPTRHLFYRTLDPRNRPADRGPVMARLVLPPFKAGARLVARTTAGQFENSTWDWIYLSRVVPILASSYSTAQFPHFSRGPDAVDADLSYLLEEAGENILILHAPALLSYNLTGKERWLRFHFGFRNGAYSNGGQTDGATFLVELHRPGLRSPEILFQKHLDPTGKEADRALQSADVPIPPDSDTAKLVIRIDPGKGNAWDWTYIPDLQLDSDLP